jgi:hypothetical protein
MSAKSSGKLPIAAFSDEAKSHVRDISATQGLIAEWSRWLHVPRLSGLECVQALRAAGFRLRSKLPGCVEVGRAELVLQVPLADQLSPDALIAILLKAGISPRRFLDLLEETKPGDMG